VKSPMFVTPFGEHESAPLGAFKEAESVAMSGRAKTRWDMLRNEVVTVCLGVSCKSRRLNSDGVLTASQDDFV
jgi:hypothetical protein